ncbi:MAG: hypothetical protein O4861_06090 [Trichodesmium sp. St16_bin4-tuft]|nr:hypothetical protein [Trichodesmium sp. MAG_R01]MDE5072210.1 hypothetical protein [Trichodesmium sp. St5_bin8]MDE5097929.1 hypothetical protein [Trichodesmium sp. St16_bin4-tuft]MDE5101634.1 hypothetical protein [Trichodesmium sp. St19_bin2]
MYKETIKKINEAKAQEGDVMIFGYCYPSQSNSWFRLKYRLGEKNAEELLSSR